MMSRNDLCTNHLENMFMLCIVPFTLLLYTKTGVYRGIFILLIFDPKPRLWVLVMKAVLTFTHNQCLERNH